MTHVLADLKFALRLLRQRPVFALVAALSIAIGVGVTTTVFSVFNALLLKPPGGVALPERVVELGRTDRRGGFDTFSWPEIAAVREQSKQLSAVAAWRISPMSFSAGRESERVMGMAASAEYFEVFGLKPAHGRFYGSSEDRVRGASHVVVLSYRFWVDRLAADPAIIGHTIDLNRRAFTVVGVMPADFRGHVPAVAPDLYFPITLFGLVRPDFDGWDQKYSSWVTAVGRLAAGASITSANAELATIFARLWSEVDARERRGARAASYGPVPQGGRAPVTAFLSLLLAFVGFILLITCANVAGMLIARAAAREKELAIRLAIGCSRGALVRQLIIESLVLFVVGGTGGVVLARWSAAALASIELPTPIPLELDVSADLRVLGFGLVLALITGLVFGLAPALQASNPALTSALKSESTRRGSRGGRLRRAFVTAQVALSLVLLASAGLFLRSLQRAAQIDTGFDPRNVYTFSFDLSMDGYNDARGEQFQARVLDRLRALPGVRSVAYAEDLPLDLGISEMPVVPEGWRDPAGRDAMGTAFSAVGGEYFDALRIPVLRGRFFGPQDTKGVGQVAVVSRTFAERAWPGQEPVGRRVRLRAFADESLTVIGVVGDVKNQMLMETTEPMIYRHTAQHYQRALSLLVRHDGGVTTASIQAVMRELDPRLSLSLIQPFDEYTSIGIMPQRIAALLSTGLGLLALILSAIGIYGVIAFTVAQRTREIGTRIALGADRRAVLNLILRDGLRLAGPGLAIGLIAALGLSHLIRAFILGVAPADPATFSAVVAVLFAVIGLACSTPALRAARIQPIVALKSD